MTFRPMPILTVFVLVSLVILIILGNWQYARYSEKMSPEYEAATTVESFESYAVFLDEDARGNVQQVYGTLTGEPVWRRYVAVRLGAPDGELALYPIEATGGANPVPMPLSAVELPATVAVNVFRRPAKRGWFTNPDQPEKDIWFTRDAPAIAANMGLADLDPVLAEPEFITIRSADDLSRVRRAENGFAYALMRDPLPPERHFGYALTWWGMAIGLLGVYLVLHHSRGRLRFKA